MCTSVIVGKNASTTGRVLLAHNEDAGGRVMHQQFWCPGGRHEPGEVLEAEPGRAKVPQVLDTLGCYWSNMLQMPPGSSFDQGFANEAGVMFCSNSGGTSFDGDLSDEEVGLVDGGIGFLLRRCVMERAHSAREAVEIAATLLTKYGYWSPARNYSFVDRNEAWLMNVVKGHHFVAKRVADDEVVLISNYLAIRHVDLEDKDNVIASPDLIEYAIEKGRYQPKKPGDFSDFDFCAAYQSQANRTDPNKSIRMRTGWQYLTGGKVYDDILHYPEHIKPSRKISPQDLKNILRLTALETYQNRGDGKTDCFHASAQDISRMHTRESWVAELGEKPTFNILWHCASNQDADPYVPWFPLGEKIPTGYQWTSRDEAHRVQFAMKPRLLDYDLDKSYFLYATLSELVNFDRGLMAGIWKIRDGLEAEFVQQTTEIISKARKLPQQETIRLLGEFTCQMTKKADNTYRALLRHLNTVTATLKEKQISVGSEDCTVEIVVTFPMTLANSQVRPCDVAWSLGFTTAKASALSPVNPIKITVDENRMHCIFPAHEVAKYAIPGCLTDTYIRGFINNRRFVAMTPVYFEA